MPTAPRCHALALMFPLVLAGILFPLNLQAAAPPDLAPEEWISPKNNATDFPPGASIAIRFNQVIAPGPGSIMIHNVGNSAPGAGHASTAPGLVAREVSPLQPDGSPDPQVTVRGNLLLINLTPPLQPGTDYILEILDNAVRGYGGGGSLEFATRGDGLVLKVIHLEHAWVADRALDSTFATPGLPTNTKKIKIIGVTQLLKDILGGIDPAFHFYSDKGQDSGQKSGGGELPELAPLPAPPPFEGNPYGEYYEQGPGFDSSIDDVFGTGPERIRRRRAPQTIEGIDAGMVYPGILPDASRNAFIILETPERMRLIEEVIAELDRPQPLVELSIAIIDISDSASFEWESELVLSSDTVDVTRDAPITAGTTGVTVPDPLFPDNIRFTNPANGRSINGTKTVHPGSGETFFVDQTGKVITQKVDTLRDVAAINTLNNGDLAFDGGGFERGTEIFGASSLGGSIVPNRNGIVGPPNITAGGFSLGTVFSATRGNAYDIRSYIRTLETDGQAQVLSRPSLLTLNNHTAELTDTITFYIRISGQKVSALKSVQSGTEIRILPRIVELDDGAGRALDLLVDITEGKDGVADSLDGIPVVGHSRVQTRAVVRENESLLIAGSYQHNEDRNEGFVPIIGKIPILGLPFKDKRVGRVKTQRMFLVTPRILDADVESLSRSNERIARMLREQGPGDAGLELNQTAEGQVQNARRATEATGGPKFRLFPRLRRAWHTNQNP